MPDTAIRLLLLLSPLLLTPVLLHLIAYGYLNFGGGEKDLVLLLPWLLWSLLYGLAFAVLWKRGWRRVNAVTRSMLVATATMALLWGALSIFAPAWLGVRG